MPINVFGSNLNKSENKNDSSLFVQKTYLRTTYIEANIEEEIDIKNQKRIKSLPFPTEKIDAVCKAFVDSGLYDPSINRSITHFDLNDK